MRTILKGVYATLIAAFMFSGSAALIGCNTTEGAGKDIKSTGNAIEHAAKDAKD
jgi:predicted small secreted protein